MGKWSPAARRRWKKLWADHPEWKQRISEKLKKKNGTESFKITICKYCKRPFIIALLLLSITTSAFAYSVFRYTDENGQPRVMRCYDNGNCVVE